MTLRFRLQFVAMALIAIGVGTQAAAVDYPGDPPGPATATAADGRLRLENAALSVQWRIEGGRLGPATVTDKAAGKSLSADKEALAVVLEGMPPIGGSAMKLGDVAVVPKAAADGVSTSTSNSEAVEIVLTLADPHSGLKVNWRAVMRDQSNYVRQYVTLKAGEKEVRLREIVFFDLPAADARPSGGVPGSPALAGNLFFACEHPSSRNTAADGRIRCALPHDIVLRPGESLRFSCVVGVSPPGQMRRAFLYYVNRERSRAYQPFLHYNSWYDIAWNDRKMDENMCLDVIETLGRELVDKRGVRLDSFVFDDGWDDNKTLWLFHSGFPNGFTPHRDAAARRGSAVGVWVSPWGGYSLAKAERLKYGATQGFETNRRGFSLGGPKYYARFRQVCFDMIDKYGVNYFKFDGIGTNPAELEALLRLTDDLRAKQHDLYISMTVGTWASPYWLWHGDSIWRGGADMSFHGAGPARQRWVTYRDMVSHRGVVRQGPLFPLNSLMSQGIVNAQLGYATRLDADLKGWVQEVRSFFGSGTQLQELYITPKSLSPEMWDVLAEGARWSRANAETLVDVRWIGGDPGKGQVYGWAAWSPRKGIITLRNPSDKAAAYSLRLAEALELPKAAPRRFVLKSPWADEADGPAISLDAGASRQFALDPFAVLTLEATPAAD